MCLVPLRILFLGYCVFKDSFQDPFGDSLFAYYVLRGSFQGAVCLGFPLRLPLGIPV